MTSLLSMCCYWIMPLSLSLFWQYMSLQRTYSFPLVVYMVDKISTLDSINAQHVWFIFSKWCMTQNCEWLKIFCLFILWLARKISIWWIVDKTDHTGCSCSQHKNQTHAKIITLSMSSWLKTVFFQVSEYKQIHYVPYWKLLRS